MATCSATTPKPTPKTGVSTSTAEAAATYDEIGRRYRTRRRPDPRIAAQIHAALGDAQNVVDLGAGTGSYEPTDRTVVALEPSLVMINQRAPGTAPVVRGDAARLPFPSGSCDAALAILTVHHWADRRAGLTEMCRVARRRIVFTFDLDMQRDFWLLRDYVPAAIDIDASRAPTVDEIADAIGASRIEIVPVPRDCTDGFGLAYWARPQAYLDPEVRACISCLAQLDPADVDPGIARLDADLRSGHWHERYGHTLAGDSFDGGYRLVIAE
jgi:SAM-dependent methyltransferase